MSTLKKLCICAVCVALCCVLPSAFHIFGEAGGRTLSPMHFPVLLCGLICGWSYGGACGLLGPVLAFLTTHMPQPPRLFYMPFELMAYGALTGLFMRLIHTKRTYLDLLLSMIPAMLLGRMVGGLAQGAVLLSGATEYSLTLWASGYLVSTLPGAIAQLIVIPAIYLVLEKSGLIPPRYPKAAV